MGSLIKRDLQLSIVTVSIISGGGCMHRNCCKSKIQNSKKIKFSKKLLDVKEYTNAEGQTNCKVATSTTRQCNNNDNDNDNDNDNNNNIKEKLVWSS